MEMEKYCEECNGELVCPDCEGYSFIEEDVLIRLLKWNKENKQELTANGFIDANLNAIGY